MRRRLRRGSSAAAAIFGVPHDSAPHNARLSIRRIRLEHECVEVVWVWFRDGENLAMLVRPHSQQTGHP
jgi:hypothetical protein